MANILYNEIAGNVHLLPITGIEMVKQLESGNTFINLHNPELDSNYKILSKAKTDMYGGSRLLGYLVDITVYFPYNNFSADYVQFLDSLPNMQQEEGFMELVFTLKLGKHVSQEPEVNYVNSTSTANITLVNPSITVDIESVELRPRIAIKVNQFVKSLEGTIIK